TTTASWPSVRSARPAYQGPPPPPRPGPPTTSGDRGPITASRRTTRKRKRQGEHEGEREARQRSPDRSLAGVRVVDEADPRARPAGGEPLKEAEARQPRDDLSGPHLRSHEGVAVAGDP